MNAIRLGDGDIITTVSPFGPNPQEENWHVSYSIKVEGTILSYGIYWLLNIMQGHSIRYAHCGRSCCHPRQTEEALSTSSRSIPSPCHESRVKLTFLSQIFIYCSILSKLPQYSIHPRRGYRFVYLGLTSQASCIPMSHFLGKAGSFATGKHPLKTHLVPRLQS